MAIQAGPSDLEPHQAQFHWCLRCQRQPQRSSVGTAPDPVQKELGLFLGQNWWEVQILQLVRPPITNPSLILVLGTESP